MHKGITPVIAMILLILIVIALGGVFAAWTTRTWETMSERSEEQVETVTENLATTFSIDNVGSNRVYIRNMGSNPLDNDTIGVYIDGTSLNYTLSDDVQPGQVGEIIVEGLWKLSEGKHKLKVSGSGYSNGIPVKIKPADGVVLSLNFNDGPGSSTAHDSSGYNNHGTLTNMNPASDWVAGKNGYALEFDGNDDHVDCGDDASLDLTSGFTLSGWVYRLGPGNPFGGYIISKRNGNNIQYGMFISNAPQLFFIGWPPAPPGPPGPEYDTGYTFPNNEWHHLTMVFDTNTVETYVDGESIGTITVDFLVSQPAVNVLIGARENGATYRYWFNGRIDDVRIYNRMLTPEEMMVFSRD